MAATASRYVLLIIVIVGLIASHGSRTWAAGAAMPRNNKAVVIGGIEPCVGPPRRGGPRYAAGTVTVLKGRVTWKRINSHWRKPIFPTHVVALAFVTTNQTYRFVLAPGHYVLKASYSEPSNVTPFTQVTLKPGAVVHVDIPDLCF